MSSNIIKGLSVTYLDVPNAVGKHVHSPNFAIYTSMSFHFSTSILKAYPKEVSLPHPPSHQIKVDDLFVDDFCKLNPTPGPQSK